MGQGFASRWAWRRVTRELQAREGGRLLYLQKDGEVVDLGACSREDLQALAWATQVAYRLTRDRGERSRLASLRPLTARLSSRAEAGARGQEAQGP